MDQRGDLDIDDTKDPPLWPIVLGALVFVFALIVGALSVLVFALRCAWEAGG